MGIQLRIASQTEERESRQRTTSVEGGKRPIRTQGEGTFKSIITIV